MRIPVALWVVTVVCAVAVVFTDVTIVLKVLLWLLALGFGALLVTAGRRPGG